MGFYQHVTASTVVNKKQSPVYGATGVVGGFWLLFLVQPQVVNRWKDSNALPPSLHLNVEGQASP